MNTGKESFQKMKNKSVCIIILNLNGKDFTENCLESIKKNTKYKNYKVVVVDNNSSDGSQKLLESKFKWVDLIQNKSNRGFSGGNNDGIKYAIKNYNPNYFYLLNNDTLVKKNWLSEAIKTAKKSKKIGLVGSKQLTFNKKNARSAGWVKPFGVKYYWGNKEKEVEWVAGAGFLIKREVIEEIGLLDEIYNPAYYEETDFEKRALNAGFKIIFCPKSIFFHRGGGTAPKEKSYLVKLSSRNRYIYYSKYYSKIYFLPRFLLDVYHGIKNKNLKYVLLGYKEGKKIIFEEKRK